MSSTKIKIEPDPDFSRLERVLRNQGEPDRVPFFELFSNLQPPILDMLGYEFLPANPGELPAEVFVNNRLTNGINYSYNLGYDYVSLSAIRAAMPRKPRSATMTRQGERSYIQGSDVTIANREDFEKYPWPKVEDIDFSMFDLARERMPEGMKGYAGSTGILENTMWLLGYEGISYLLFDDEQLVADVFEGRALGAIMGAIDVGFAIGASIGPALGGLVFDATGSYAIAFTVGAFAMLITAFMVALVGHSRVINTTE